MELKHSEDNRCKINLKLYTGKIDVAGKKITKNYTGDMITSIPLSSCYCILINESIGENRRPTLHRMVISKHEFDLQGDNLDLHFLKGQLKLNDSQIMLSKASFEELKKYILKNNLEEFQTFFSLFEDSCSKEEYYIIDENKLLDSTISVSTKIQCISLLSEKSKTRLIVLDF